MSSIIVSPECIGNTGRVEAIADGAIKPGNFISYTATGCNVSTAAGSRQMVATENISIAGDINTDYAATENVFSAALPAGCRVHATMAAATYAAGDLLEIGANGRLTALAAGTAVAVVPVGKGGTLSDDDLLIVQLI